jgi:bacillithiol system protein YtxJ
VSTDAQRQFDAAADVPEGDRATWVYLDLIRYRDLSNAIAERTGISHASPQTILLWKGEVVWDASHWSITTSALNEAVLVDEA